MAKGPSIEALASSVTDNGRRGESKPGCDCMQCFGYCMVNADQAVRDQALKHDSVFPRRPDTGSTSDSSTATCNGLN